MSSPMPAPFDVILPQLLPSAARIRQDVGAAFLGDLADYVTCAENLSPAGAAVALAALAKKLPSATPLAAPASKPRFMGYPQPADDAAHDRYFNVQRVAGSESAAFLHSVLQAGVLYHSETAAEPVPGMATRFTAMARALDAVLADVAEVPCPRVQLPATDMPSPRRDNPMRRWVLGHQIFATLTQALIYGLQEFELAMEQDREARAQVALELCTDLLLASGNAFRFTADFPPAAYADVVRPTMMDESVVGAGFSGLLSVDHRRLVATLARLRPLMARTAERLPTAHVQLKAAMQRVYADHKFVCARFGGEEKPSLRCPNSSPLPGVEQIERFEHARVELLQPNSSGDVVIV